MLNELIKDLIGVPWKENGRDVKTGLDCYGLVLEVSKRAGLSAFDCNDPIFNKTIWENNEDVCKGFSKYGFGLDKTKEGKSDDILYVKIDRPEPGCMVLFRLFYPYISHIGVVLDDCDSFIHSPSNKKLVCIERLSSVAWRHRIAGYYKWTKKLQ